MAPPVFYFDFSSPYAYLAASRIDEVVPQALWRPISFGILIREIGKVPWSLRPGREQHLQEIAERAERRGLPPVRYPDGWPDRTYSLAPLRAAMLADREGVLKPFTAAAYRLMFASGRGLHDLDCVVEAGAAAGLDPRAVRESVDDPQAKARLREHTEEALTRGVAGIPTVAVGDELFFGDDHLEAAAAASG